MRYMLDTNVVSLALRGRSPPLVERLRAVRPAEVCISVVTLAELRFGAARSASKDVYDGRIDTFTSRVSVLAFDEVAARRYGEVRAALEVAGQKIGPLDTMIAGHALSASCVVVTTNTREFCRVTGLVVEDWTLLP
jgi:tRNA(fMet)-specific endonuclease VapC